MMWAVEIHNTQNMYLKEEFREEEQISSIILFSLQLKIAPGTRDVLNCIKHSNFKDLPIS